MATSDTFFQRRQAAAVLKHGVVKRYSTVFTTMTSTNSPGRRVVYLDGYAGRGGYEDGTPGSPLLALETAEAVAEWNRGVECIFVEAEKANYQELERRLLEAARDRSRWRVRQGNIVDHLDETLALARGLPLLAFLDPFGTALPFDVLVKRLLGRPDAAPTEVLLNLNIDVVQRWGGLLTVEARNPGHEGILGRLDDFFGGDWWREVYLRSRGGESALTASQAALAVIGEFQRRVREQTGHGAFPVPIRRKPGHLPLFLLVLFYRHPVAPWKFNEAASGANAEWRAACRSEALVDEEGRRQGQMTLEDELLGSPEQRAAAEEDHLGEEWVTEISGNLRRMAAENRSIQIQSRIADVYGRTLGLARDKHVRWAWDALAKEGVLRPRERGPVYQATIASPR